MEKEEFRRSKKQFDDFKAEYSCRKTTDERKKALIPLMQMNLKERCGKDSGTIVCDDGREHSLTSNNVEDLFAIDGALNAEASKNKLTETADISRKESFEQNKYGPDKTYPEK